MRSQNATFTEGKIAGPLIRFALPVLLAMCLQSLYGAVDLLVVGQFGDAADVSAVSTGSQMMQMITVMFTGLAMGTTILLGQAIGAGKSEEAGRIVGSGTCFFAVLALIVSVLMVIFSRGTTKLMQAPEEAFEKTVSYVRICSSGILFIVAYNVIGSIFRGIGDSRTPLITVAIACVFNIIGDLLFVAVFHMAAAGAALATIMAQALSVVISLLIIRKQGLPFAFSRSDLTFDSTHIRHMLRLGVPMALQDTLVSLSFLIIAAIVNSLGLIASAGVGVAEKVIAFIMLVPSAFMQSLSSFVAQNVGAGKPDRAKKAMLVAIGFSMIFDVVLAWAGYFHGDALSAIFTKDPDVIAAGFEYLRSYSIDTLLVSFLFCFLGYFTGFGKTTFVMIQSLAGSFLVRIPVSWLMSRQVPASLFNIALAAPCSTVVQIVLCLIYFAVIRRQQKSLP